MKSTAKKRILYALVSLLLFLTEIFIALFVHDAFIRPYIGDVLVVILLYCIVRIAFPENLRLLPVYIFAFACFTEFLQYLHVIELMGLQDNAFFRVLIGSVFDWSDIICYAAGCALVYIFSLVISITKSKINMI